MAHLLKNRVALTALLTAVAALSSACVSTAPAAPDPAVESAPEAPSAGKIVRLDPRAAPTAQRVRLRLDPASTTYSGSTTIDLTLSEPTDEILFHAEGQAFDDLTLTGPDGEVEVEVAREDQGVVRLAIVDGFAAGDYTLSIDFTQEFNTKAVGLYRAEYRGTPYLFTQLQAIDARKAFPCWDEPGFKVPYQLTIAVPEGNLAVTNTPTTAIETVDGWVRSEFAATPPTPSYLLAIAVGPFEAVEVEGMGVPGRILSVEGFSHLTATAAQMSGPILAALEDYFGSPYPYAKLDQIAVPEFWPGAMENPGLITYADRILLQEPDPGSRQRRRLAQVMAHEFAHMWFGDLVTMQWWDDLWLNESFAAWMENKIPQQLYPELRAGLQGRAATQDVMSGDARPSARPIRRQVVTTADIFGDLGVIYEKGAGVLTMVEQWLGEEAFRDGVRGYMREHAWGNATADDFWAALSEASGEDVASILTSFVLQPGLPLVRVEEREDGLWLSQQRFHAAGAEVDAQTWKVPVTVRFAAGGGQALLLEADPVRLEAAADVAWVLPDAGARGYYRWVVPSDQLDRMAGEASAELTPRERASVLDNAAALLDADVIDGDAYLALLETFASDFDPDVLSQVLDGVDKIGDSFVTDENRDQFAGYVRSLLQPIAERLGWQRVEGEIETTHILRRRVFTALGTYGRDADVRVLARQMAEAYLADPQSVDDELGSRALRIAAIEGDEALFDTYQQRFENPQSPQDRQLYLTALAGFSDPELRQRVREYALSDAVKPTELFGAMGGGSTDVEAVETMRWALDHYEGFEEKVNPEFLGFMPFVASGCSRERLEEATEFFSEPEHQVPGTLRTLQRVTEQVEECVALREREGEAVNAYLER